MASVEEFVVLANPLFKGPHCQCSFFSRGQSSLKELDIPVDELEENGTPPSSPDMATDQILIKRNDSQICPVSDRYQQPYSPV